MKITRDWIAKPESSWRRFLLTYLRNLDNIYLDLPKGAKWFLKSINHPVGFYWHPLEGAGRWFQIYTLIFLPEIEEDDSFCSLKF